MNAIELLQQIGLNKYEAEAYYTLLLEGPLTGYELGKRSSIPLSRSYDTLEKLTQQGLALAQPGDPPRYLAEQPSQFLGRMRENMTTTLDTLTSTLLLLARPATSSDFWVIRNRQPILNRAHTLLSEAQQTVFLATNDEKLGSELIADVQVTYCQRFSLPTTETQALLALVDGCEALIATLAPADRCQGVVSANPALLTALQVYFACQPPLSLQHTPIVRQDDWLAWEERKQRRLWPIATQNRTA